MSNQVKLYPETKREVSLFSAATGKTQGDLLAEAWREWKERHSGELTDELQWARDALQSPAQASVAASGMAREDIDELHDAFGG